MATATQGQISGLEIINKYVNRGRQIGNDLDIRVLNDKID